MKRWIVSMIVSVDGILILLYRYNNIWVEQWNMYYVANGTLGRSSSEDDVRSEI